MVQKNKDIIEIPIGVWASAKSLNDLENWLIANAPGSISALSEARQQHIRGELISLEEIKNRIAKRTAKD